jgi:acyl-[acyl-carrier-protein] desaturase
MSMDRHVEVVESMKDFVREHLDSLLMPVEESWQPSDFLPDLTAEDWPQRLAAFRERAGELPRDVLAVLVGDMVTEEALPTYQSWINRLNGLADPTGVSDNPWARWSRGWTAEENRHGDLLNRYLTLTGRINMRSVEVTIHHLLNRGFDPLTENDPYLGFVYTSFQERATKISHRNVATLAKRAGEETLHTICGRIAGDEARHEKAYKLFMSRVFELDPAGAVRAFAVMMKRKITMPAVLMYDGVEENLFAKFSRVAQQTGVYTAADYADIVDDLVQSWGVARIPGLSDLSAKAQEYVCGLADRYRALAGRVPATCSEEFSWLVASGA